MRPHERHRYLCVVRRHPCGRAVGAGAPPRRGAGQTVSPRRSHHPGDARRDGVGPPDVACAGHAVSRPARHLRGSAARRNRGEPARARRGRSTRSRSRGRQDPRSAARHPRRIEGQHSHDRHADDRRRARVRRPRAAVRSDVDEEPSRCRRHHRRQDRTDRARQLGRGRAESDAGQLQRRRWLRLQPLRSEARSARGDVRRTAGIADRRIELRHRNRGEPVGRQRRDRHRRLRDQPVQCEHARRHPSDHRPDQPVWRDSHHRGSRHGRADDAHGHRRRDHARRAREPVTGSQRPGDDHVHAAARPRLHEVPARRRAEGRPHRHSTRLLLRPHHAERRSPATVRRASARRRRSRPGAAA